MGVGGCERARETNSQGDTNSTAQTGNLSENTTPHHTTPRNTQERKKRYRQFLGCNPVDDIPRRLDGLSMVVVRGGDSHIVSQSDT